MSTSKQPTPTEALLANAAGGDVDGDDESNDEGPTVVETDPTKRYIRVRAQQRRVFGGRGRAACRFSVAALQRVPAAVCGGTDSGA